MSFKQMAGLSADWDRQEGRFIMPPELAAAEELVRMDVLADWIDAMEGELLKASVSYFAYLVEEVNDRSITFEMHLAAFDNMLVGLEIRQPAGLREHCLKAYESFMKRS